MHTSKSVKFCLFQSTFSTWMVALLSAFSVTSTFASALMSCWFCVTEKNSELSPWNCFLPPVPLLSKEPSASITPEVEATPQQEHLCPQCVCMGRGKGPLSRTHHTGLT